MTWRAVIFGLMGALLLGAGGQYASKYIPGMWGFVRGHMPVSVYGLLIFYVILINPLIGKIRASWRLRNMELALIMAMTLVACGITDGGMMRYFPRQLIHPIHLNRTHPGWQKAGLLEKVPPAMLANDGKYSEAVVENYVGEMWDASQKISFKESPLYALWKTVTFGGKPERTVSWKRWIGTGFGRAIPITAVPWHAWWKPLLLWTSVILSSMLAVVSLAVMVHRQWADRERIRYPLAELASSLLRQDEKGNIVILKNRMFWIGLGIPFLIRVINGLYVWFPGSIEIQTSLDFSAINAAFPIFMKTPGAGNFANPTLFPACVGLTYLLASDIGLSLGLSGIVSVFAFYALMSMGLDLSGSEMMGGTKEFFSFGTFLAMGVMLIYIGRRHYWQTLKEAVTFRRQLETEASGVWACRGFIGSMLLCIGILSVAGMDPVMACLGMLLVMLLFMVSTRMNAECGVFFFNPMWAIPGVVVGLFGGSVLGPAVIICLGMMRYLIQADSFECMMPFAANGLKMSSDTGLKIGRVGLVFAGAIALTILVAAPTALWADYNNAASLRRGADGGEVFSAAERVTSQLALSGELKEASAYNSWDRIRHMQMDRRFLWGAGVGFGLLLLFSAMRLRYTWWPFHPVLLLGFGALGRFSFSFLIGYMIKVAVTKFGGVSRYTAVKPMMIGVVVGDLAGIFVFMVVNWVYYALTGASAKNVLPW